MEIPVIIQLVPIVRVNSCIPILHPTKRIVHIYTAGKTPNQFAIGYMINPSLNFNNTFRTQIGKFLGDHFSITTIKNI